MQRRLTETLTRRDALVAEEQSQVIAAVARARAELEVQKARLEQVRSQLEADVVVPARADAEASEARAKAQTASISEEGRARADALRRLAETYQMAGPSAREVLLTQKLGGIIEALTDTIPDTHVDKVTMIDSRSGSGNMAGKAISTLEQIKHLFGIDVVEKINAIGVTKQEKQAPPRAELVHPVIPPAPATAEPPKPTVEIVQQPKKMKKPPVQFQVPEQNS